MKVLTSVAPMVPVVSVITAFFGMNFMALPQGSSEWFCATAVAIVVVSVALFAYFRRLGWL